ncbi:MAG: hypothetical protein ACRC35_04640 [Angustibacter sp.]
MPPDPAPDHRAWGPVDRTGELRRGVLAVSVLDDVMVEPRDDGILVGPEAQDRDQWISVSWSALAAALRGAQPLSPAGRLRLRTWLQALVDCLADPPAVRQRAVPLALPRDHDLHPGPAWAAEPVLGGVLDLGVGLRPAPRASASPDHPGLAVPLPPAVTAAAGLDVTTWWTGLAAYREAMAELVLDRHRREGAGRYRTLRPVGGCDVLTLLTSPALRHGLVATDGAGLRAVAVPIRSRGWFDLGRIDPAFVGAAATATEPDLRGFPRPLLVTAEEVAVAPDVVSLPDLARVVLADPVTSGTLLDRDVRYR